MICSQSSGLFVSWRRSCAYDIPTGMQRQVHASTRPWDRLLSFVLLQAETSCVSRRLLDRSGYTITSTIALHHEHAAMIISLGRSVRCGANLERCSRLRNIRRSRLVLPRLFRHGVELSLKLSCTRNGLVLDEIHPIPLHKQHDLWPTSRSRRTRGG